MKIRNLIISFTTLLVIVGCFEDKGNYDYNVYPEIRVALARQADIIAGETATFTPKITAPEGYETTYEYEWMANEKVIAKATTETLVYTTKELGRHIIVVTITDTKTGAKYFVEEGFDVISEFEKGFLILVEDGGNTDVHFVRATEIIGDYALGTNDTMMFNVEKMNIYKDVIGEPIVGKPVQMTEHWTWEAYIHGELTVETIVDGKRKFTEYNGTTMMRETYIEQEFSGGNLPENFLPKQVTHSCWDSFILNEDGFIYHRRSASSTGFHTGYFDKGVKLWGNAKFTDLHFSYYRNTDMFLAVEVDPITKERNFVGIYENIGNSHYLEDESSMRLPQSPLHPDFTNVKGEILFNDFFKYPGGYGTGMNAFILKNETGEYILQIVEYENINDKSVAFTNNCKKINLTTSHSISKVNGMFTSKSDYDRVVYFYDDHTVYFYDDGEIGVVTTYSDKTIVAAGGHLNVNREDAEEYDANELEAHIMVGFSDGTLEIIELDNIDPTKKTKVVYRSKNNFGTIKQIIYKWGNDSEFAD